MSWKLLEKRDEKVRMRKRAPEFYQKNPMNLISNTEKKEGQEESAYVFFR